MLERAGFVKWGQKGSHLTLYRASDRRALTVPIHFAKTVPKGTLRDHQPGRFDHRGIPQPPLKPVSRKSKVETITNGYEVETGAILGMSQCTSPIASGCMTPARMKRGTYVWNHWRV